MNTVNYHKPTLRYLCTFHGVDVLMLMKACSVPPLTIWAVLLDYDTTAETIHTLLCALNDIRGTTYTLNDISFHPIRERREV